jgi:hypothetical protein
MFRVPRFSGWLLAVLVSASVAFWVSSWQVSTARAAYVSARSDAPSTTLSPSERRVALEVIE